MGRPSLIKLHADEEALARWSRAAAKRGLTLRAFIEESKRAAAAALTAGVPAEHLASCDERGGKQLCDPRCPHYDGWLDGR